MCATAKCKRDEGLEQLIYSSTHSMHNDLILTLCQKTCVRHFWADRKHILKLLRSKVLNGTLVCSLTH